MKKFMSILLALTMMFSLCVTAFAENTSLTINGDHNREYVGYQLLGLSTSLKTGEHHPAGCNGTNHSSDCYNYAYTVNSKYREVLQKEVFEKSGGTFWDDSAQPATYAGVTDAQILKYLSIQISDDGDVYHTMRQVADRLYRAIKDADIDADAKNLDGIDDNIDQGYWMIADVTNLEGAEDAANSLVMVDTKGQEKLEINSKTSLPTVEKKVKDINTSNDEHIHDNAWHDSADHDIGDVIPFKLTATLPSNFRAYIVRDAGGDSIHPYKLIYHDKMSTGLTLNPDSIKVYRYDSLHKANADTAMNNYQEDVTSYFSTNTTCIDGCTLEVSCEDVIKIPDVTKDSVFVVYYEAALNGSAVVGAAGNPNEVHLEYSNDPYSDSTGETEEDKVKVFTYQLVINKTDSHGHALKGAGFKLYKKNLAGEYVLLGDEMKGDDMTTFTWTGLDDGDYKLEESTVPAGYNKLSDIVFSISAVHSETSGASGEPELTVLDGGLMGTGEMVEGKLTGRIVKDIVNNTGTVLPETGAAGTMMLIGGGTLFVMLAAVFMITRKKMSIYED